MKMRNLKKYCNNSIIVKEKMFEIMISIRRPKSFFNWLKKKKKKNFIEKQYLPDLCEYQKEEMYV